MADYKQALGDYLVLDCTRLCLILTMDQMVRYGKDLADSLLDVP